jgi:hypothetical protein
MSEEEAKKKSKFVTVTWTKIYSESATFYPEVLFLLTFPIFLILNGQIVYLTWILGKY